jgi:hypothetical protein
VEKRWEEKLWTARGFMFPILWNFGGRHPCGSLTKEWQNPNCCYTNPVNPWNSKNAELSSLWYQTTSLFLHACNLTLLPMSEKPFTEITNKQTIRYGGQQQLTRAFFFRKHNLA